MRASPKTYIYSLMRDREKGPVAGFFKSLLSVTAFFYGFLVRLHGFFYRANILKSHAAGVPVISVGNITLGGTGKTPFTLMLARHFSEKGKKTGVLIRGYGEDEWKMLEENLKDTGAEVFVGRDRVEQASIALKKQKDIIILDDGFQHRRLRRDLDIVLIDAHHPFGNRSMFPRGILREPIDGLKRGDIFILTKTDAAQDKRYALTKEIKEITKGRPVLLARHTARDFVDINGEKKEKREDLKGKTVCLLSAICDPDYFAHTAGSCGLSVGTHFSFPDHYDYRLQDLEKVIKHCERENIEYVITTEKCAVKLRPIAKRLKSKQKLRVLRISFEIMKGKEELYAGLDRLLRN